MKSALSYGVVVSVGSQVVALQGFLTAFIGEQFKVSQSSSQASNIGIVVNLAVQPLSHVVFIGAILVSLLSASSTCSSSGSLVQGVGHLVSITLGYFSIGSIMDPLGCLVYSSTSSSSLTSLSQQSSLTSLTTFNSTCFWLVESVLPTYQAS